MKKHSYFNRVKILIISDGVLNLLTNKILNTTGYNSKIFKSKIKPCKMNVVILSHLLFCFFLQSCSENATGVNNGIGTWTKVESGLTNWLYDIDFPDEQNGWIVGDSGIILNSGNGGESWNLQSCPTEDILFAVDFVDNKNGWACSRNAILGTTNGGETWEIKYIEDLDEGRFRDIQFLNQNTGFVVGGKGSFGSIGVLLKTNDGGESWQEATPQSLSTLTHISIVNDKNIWVCGFGGTILFTTDIGLTWTKRNLNISPSPSLTRIQFIDQKNGWTSSRDDYLGFYITIDGGRNWLGISEESFKIIGGVQSFYFIDNKRGWMCNFPFDRILRTTDGGLTWQYDSEIRQKINSFFFVENKTGWAIGSNGSILKYSSVY